MASTNRMINRVTTLTALPLLPGLAVCSADLSACSASGGMQQARRDGPPQAHNGDTNTPPLASAGGGVFRGLSCRRQQPAPRRAILAASSINSKGHGWPSIIGGFPSAAVA